MAKVLKAGESFLSTLPRDEEGVRLFIRRKVIFRSTTETPRISSVATGAFLDNLSAGAMAIIGAYPLLQVDVYYGSTLLRGYTGSAKIGDGEDLGLEQITGWDNVAGSAYETFTLNANGRDFDSAINSSGAGIAVTTNGAPLGSAGKLMKWAYSRTVNSGSAPNIAITTIFNGATTDLPAITAAASGNRYITFTGARYLANYITGATNFSATHSLKQVTGPSTSGCLLYNSRAMTTQSLLVNTFAAGSYNQSAYTVIISRVR